MSTAPAWVSYAALALAAGSLVVATLAYRAGSPRLSLRASRILDGVAEGSATFELTVTNAGRAAVSVQSFHLTPYGARSAVIALTNVDGPELPFRLDAHASETWTVDALPAARKYDAMRRSGELKPRSTWPSHILFTVAAGDGKSARDRQQFDSLRMIAGTD
jgi:hypothetical protein